MGKAKVPSDPSMSSEVRGFLEALQQQADSIPANLGTAAAEDVGTAAGNVVQLDGSAKLPALDGSQLTNLPAQTGRLVAGTPAIMNPLAVTSTATAAHGLGGAPSFIDFYAECLTAEGNYSVGDRVRGMTQSAPMYGANTTNVFISTSNSAVTLPNKTTGGSLFTLTGANWKLVATPYKLT